jgi:hypothetical protein
MISINPVITTNAAGTFSVSLDGLMQGMAMDDPAVRYQLTGGQLAPTEVLPMFGGVPIAEFIPPIPPVNAITGLPMGWDPALQNSIQRATAAIPASGISVFNQNHAMINSPQSPVPQCDIGMLVNFYRFGSRARIAMAMDPAFNPVIAAPGLPIAGAGVPPAASFFFNIANQWVNATAAGGIPLFGCKIIGFNIGNSMVVAYDAASGFATWVRDGNAILLEI